jgi:predicted AlkP superfamily pyrophosphatase or phosphodiesterase
MKGFVLCMVMLLAGISVTTQKAPQAFNPENKLVIITLDGLRWQEIFNGADSAIIHNPEQTIDTGINKALYWGNTTDERRKKLMPFLWSVVASRGQLFGNRNYGNNVNVSNPYALSYPGYSELLTGSVDFRITGNHKRKNQNRNVLEVLNKSASYSGKVAAFTSWDLFPFILNTDRSRLQLNSGLQQVSDGHLTKTESLINSLQSEVAGEEEMETRYDALTYIACKEYMQKHKPSVVFLSFSGTDNAGHSGRYDQYLQEASNADRMIGELWRQLQTMPEYAGKTTFLITTDHGRGAKESNWSKHGFFVRGASQTWFALMGPTIVPSGEMKVENQVYQKELHDLILDVLSR